MNLQITSTWRALFFCLAAAGCWTSNLYGQAEHEVLTASAWQSFASKDYKAAMRDAELIIEKYAAEAESLQKKLSDAKETPPVGVVTADEAKAIHARGTLNDVGAAYLIGAKAAFKLGMLDKSKDLFGKGSKLEGARVWEAKGKFFWATAGISKRCMKDPSLSDRAEHELITVDAWEALGKSEFEAAVKHADLCFKQYAEAAKQMQADLVSRNATVAEGIVDDDAKTKIFQNGILNDVCTCLFIKGQAAEKLNDNKLAKSAYQAAAEFSQARCWDPQGWFWAPAEASKERLSELK